jgi:cellulose synthase/poly-beta-1,6-N-acetylglucosamine synthase-like glycosyltransferase
MPASPLEANRPLVSVIVPARNEEDCLGLCLESLLAQKDVGFEIIAVDDHSTDGTRTIAMSFPDVRVVDAGPLPLGWTGKCNAVTCGARAAHGSWLLFTDADTVHKSGSLARAMREAEERGVALLSYSPEQEVHSLVERAVMPVIFAELATRYRPSKVSDPTSDVAAANGQYVLVSREAYDAVGGHAAIAGSLLEDVELARALKRSGKRIFFRWGADQVRTRMYRTTPQLIEGWTKNLALLFPSPVQLAYLRATEFVVIWASGILGLVFLWRGQVAFASWTLAACGFAKLFFWRRILRAHFAWGSIVLAIFGLPFFSFLLLRSAISYKRGRVTWKGRNYTGGMAS